MKKTKTRKMEEQAPASFEMTSGTGELVAMASAQAIKMLMSVKVSFERLERYMDIHGMAGTYMGRDLYETVQGVHDTVSEALAFLLPPEGEREVRARVFGGDDAEFEKMCSEVEEREVCGHA